MVSFLIFFVFFGTFLDVVSQVVISIAVDCPERIKGGMLSTA